jgi:hypothetical protein
MFMIFDRQAINFDMVTRMCETEFGGVDISTVEDSYRVEGVTIDQILTALAAGHWHFDDGSKRGQVTGNDPQALHSIGRRMPDGKMNQT